MKTEAKHSVRIAALRSGGHYNDGTELILWCNAIPFSKVDIDFIDLQVLVRCNQLKLAECRFLLLSRYLQKPEMRKGDFCWHFLL
jgi:hypothetical protein